MKKIEKHILENVTGLTSINNLRLKDGYYFFRGSVEKDGKVAANALVEIIGVDLSHTHPIEFRAESSFLDFRLRN